ncbi:Uncharacterised protein [Mycobacterium tuberculosis]|nr:Uncharacterised protein [Mycobacterium tuberculosis]
MVPATVHSVMITMLGLTHAGSTSHCGPWMPNRRRNWLIAPELPFRRRKNTAAVATAGVIFGR